VKSQFAAPIPQSLTQQPLVRHIFALTANQTREGKQTMDHLALGAMGSLLPKLGELLKEEYKMQTSVKRDVELFSRELGSMRAALERVAEVPCNQLDQEVRLWAGDVRELSYDMEDIIESLLVCVKGSKQVVHQRIQQVVYQQYNILFSNNTTNIQTIVVHFIFTTLDTHDSHTLIHGQVIIN
jgi:hypothetical protein